MPIRYGSLADLDRLSEIEQASYPPEEGASRESIEERLQSFPNHFWLYELPDGKIAAFINGLVTNESDLRDEMYDHSELHDEEGQWQMIFSVVTAPDMRGQGYASELMEQVLHDARTQNRAGVVLTCKNELVGFYARHGFVDEGISTSSHGGAIWHQMRLRTT